MVFEDSKRYVFSKDKWLADTGNVLLYQGNPYLRGLVDKAEGQEVEKITNGTDWGQIGKLVVYPHYCDIIKSKRKTTFRDAVNHLMLEDKHAQLHEYINTLCADKKRLEQRLGAINKELTRREQELFETERELKR